MKLWFHEYYTEAHRKPGEGDVLAYELGRFGIEATRELTEDCDFGFCGGFLNYRKCLEEYAKYPQVPMIYYSWDIYPFQLEGDPTYFGTQWWKEYIEILKDVDRVVDIWVPSRCSIDRVREFVGRSAHVIKTSVRTWETEIPPHDGRYVMNVMRRYPGDPNLEALAEACRELDIPLKEPGGGLSWDEFRATVVGATLLVSPFWEASTGALTLLEGYWHGKDVLLARSPRNGVVDYFEDRAPYFQWDDHKQLREILERMYHHPQPCLPAELEARRFWMRKEFSEVAMAERMARRLTTLKRRQRARRH